MVRKQTSRGDSDNDKGEADTYCAAVTRAATLLTKATCVSIRIALRRPESMCAMHIVTRLRQALRNQDDQVTSTSDKHAQAELLLLIELLSLRTIVRRWSKLSPITRHNVVQTACLLCARLQGDAAARCAVLLRDLDVPGSSGITREQRTNIDSLIARAADAAALAEYDHVTQPGT